MKIFEDFNNLPTKLQREITLNSKDMHDFYTMPTGKRQDILNRISTLNSKEEFEDFIK